MKQSKQIASSKPVEFLGNSLENLRAFPKSVSRELGFQIDRVQNGLEPNDWKPMSSVGAGVQEIRVRDEAGAFRVIYVAKFEKAVYVLHCFQKKTPKTAATDIEIAKKAYKQLMRDLKG